MAAALAAAAVACGGLNPGGERVQIDGVKVAPDRIDRLPVTRVGAMAAGPEGQVYVQGQVEDRATDGYLWPIHRKSPEGEWDEVVGDPGFVHLLLRRPGTSEVYASTCDPRPRDESGPLRLYRMTEHDGLTEVSEEYWGQLSPEVLTDLGIADCLASWAMLPDGAVVLATPSTLWRVAGGHAEVVIENLPAALGIEENLARADRTSGRPDIRVGDRGEVLLFLTGGLYNPAPLQPIAFRLVGTKVEPIDLGADYSIRDAAVGPDGAAYLLAYNVEEQGLLVRGIRVLDEERSEFLSARSIYDGAVEAISIDAEGRLYLVYGTTGSMFSSPEWWLLGFPTEDIISRSTPN